MLSTDLGQVANPPVEDGLALMADRLLEAGFSEDEMPHDGGRQHEEARRCLRRSSSSARTPPTSSGAPRARSPTVVEDGGTAHVVALSYGERGESGELWKEAGQTEERVKEIRHGEAQTAAAALGADFRSLDLGDYPLVMDARRRRAR